MLKSGHRTLVLDFGGVISRTMFETHALTEQALGLAPGTLTWRGPFAATGDDPLWTDMQSGKITERDYWHIRARETGSLLGKHWTRMEDFVRAARGADPRAIIRPEALSAIATANRCGINLAILSNELDLFYGAEFRHKLPMLSLFKVIVDATYTNVLKPDPRAYQAICDALTCSPDKCVFVDDQLKNVIGAREFGMLAVHFDVKNLSESYREALVLLGVNEQEIHS